MKFKVFETTNEQGNKRYIIKFREHWWNKWTTRTKDEKPIMYLKWHEAEQRCWFLNEQYN